MTDFDPVAAAAQLRQAIIDDAPKLFADNQRLRAEVAQLRGFAEWLIEAYHSDDGMPEAKDIAREARTALKEQKK